MAFRQMLPSVELPFPKPTFFSLAEMLLSLVVFASKFVVRVSVSSAQPMSGGRRMVAHVHSYSSLVTICLLDWVFMANWLIYTHKSA